MRGIWRKWNRRQKKTRFYCQNKQVNEGIFRILRFKQVYLSQYSFTLTLKVLS